MESKKANEGIIDRTKHRDGSKDIFTDFVVLFSTNAARVWSRRRDSSAICL